MESAKQFKNKILPSFNHLIHLSTSMLPSPSPQSSDLAQGIEMDIITTSNNNSNSNPITPLLVQDIEIQAIPDTTTPTNNNNPNSNQINSIFPDLDLGKTILGLAFSAMIPLLTFVNQRYLANQSQPPMSLYLLILAIMIAFSTSLIGITSRQQLPSVAPAMEHIAVISMVTAFFIFMDFLLPEELSWFLWIPFVLVLLFFVSPLFKVLYDAMCKGGGGGGGESA